jgi:uncharacterized protein (TIGR02611 family)
MKHSLLFARKVGVFILGVSVFILGIILIPLPGPGILVCMLGLFILSWEFAWAARHLDRAKTAHKKLIAKATQKKKMPTKNP